MNFYKSLRNLDHHAEEESGLCAIPTGRAYMGAHGPYADKIHILPFAEKLQLGKLAHGGLYIGTAGILNFGHLAQLKPDYAVLFDVNPFQIVFWNIVLSGIRHNKDYESFCRFFSYSEVITRRIIKQKLGELTFSSAGSWTKDLHYDDGVSLSRKSFAHSATDFSHALQGLGFTGDDYAFVKQLVEQNKIGTVTLDIFDENGWNALSEVIKQFERIENGFVNEQISVYLSSILQFTKDGSDWTGRAIPHMNVLSSLSKFSSKSICVIDHQGHYPAEKFYDLLREEKPWLLPKSMKKIKASVPDYGAGRLAQPSI